MKRNLIIGLVLLAAFALTLTGFGAWCLTTTSGANWILDSANRLSDIEISRGELDGSLLNGLDIKELRVAWEGGEIQATDLTLAIRRVAPLAGQLAIANLDVSQLVLQLDESSAETAGVSDDGPGAEVLLALAPDWLELEIDRLKISGFIYRSTAGPDDEVIIADLIAGQYLLADQRLIAKDFSYHSPYVELDGVFDWPLAPPHLDMTAEVHLPATSVDPELLETILLPDRLPVHLELDGDWNGYSGPIRFGAKDESGNEVMLTALVTGSWHGARFEDIKARYLDGAITGDLDMSWIDAYQIKGQLSVRELDLSTLIDGTTGRTSFDLSGDLSVPYGDQPLQASFDGMIHETRFRGHSLQGRAAGRWFDQELAELDVDLAGDGAHLLAKGVLSQRVDFDLEVADLAVYHEELSGKAAASGWLNWSGDSLAGEIDGQAEKLQWQEVGVRRVSLHARHLAGEERVSLNMNGEDWNYGDLSVTRVTAKLSGTLSEHHLEVATESSFGHLSASARGSYQPGRWTGRIGQLIAEKTPWGRWSMPEPTGITWNEGLLTVDRLFLAADKGASMELKIDSWGSTDRASAALEWSGFDLEWLQPYSDFDSLEGRAEGQVDYKAVAGQPLSISGQIAAHGRVENEYYDLTYEKLELEFDWGEAGLQLSGTSMSDSGERVRIEATAPGPLALEWPIKSLQGNLQWQGFNLARVNRFLEGSQAEGVSDGSFTFALNAGELERMRGHLAATGRVMQGERELGPRSLQTDLSWDDEDFQCTASLSGAKGGHAVLKLTSSERPALGWPDSGVIEIKVHALSLASLEPLLPPDINIDGTIDSQARGHWESAGVVELNGDLRLRQSHISWDSDNGQVILPLRDAVSEWRWVDDSLNGSFTLNLPEHGTIGGSWELPLPARIPTGFEPDGPLKINISGNMQAIGFLSAIGPWLVQDLRGETRIELAVQGTWADPDLRGKILFNDGGAYLPAAGLQLQALQLHSELVGDRLRIDRLSVRSGSGELSGQGEVVFDRWRPTSYHLDITGKDFQVVDFPELQMTCSPDLTLEGTPKRLAMQGSILIPRLAIRGSQGVPEVLPSKDVVKEAATEQRRELEFATDIHVTVELGEDVTVKSGGVDSRLTGGGTLTMGPTGEILANGEVQLVSGSFRAHGVNLEIRQGILNYKGGVITNPELRIFAARKVGDVLAGVQVTGSAEAPVVTLYSQPPMPERDILGYMLMGRAISTENQETDMLMMGAGSLLSSYGGGLSELGITEIDIQGLFTGTGGLRLRRKLTEKWEIESNLGVESGVDLYYIIELE